MTINDLTIKTEDTFVSLLELAASNEVEAFKRWIERDPTSVHEVGLWYGRQKGSKQMVLEQRTPLMVAATYGCVDVLKLILSLPEGDVNRSCGGDKSTALHCAASGGSVNAAEAVKLLLGAGADPNSEDVNGHCPIDVIVVSPNFHPVKSCLENLLKTAAIMDCELRVPVATLNSNFLPSSPSPGNRSPPSSASDASSSPKSAESNDFPVYSMIGKKEYPIDPSLPDIKNHIYTTDEFRMFSFKIRPCSRAYSHDWTECPFAHPGENARRRDPRKYHYSCVPCPEFRNGACQRGDMCEYAHGVFECWLHPAQYRTRLCKDGIDCNRRVCFFAHTQEELRPLCVSTGSAVPSPPCWNTSAANAMDFTAAMGVLPGSPSPVSAMSPSPFTPPMSPSANGMPSMGWPQQNVPALHLPGSFLHSSRLRSSLNARDIAAADLTTRPDFDVQQQQLLNELSYLSQPNRGYNSLNRSARPMTLNHANLEDLFSAESSSPRYFDQSLAQAGFSPTHKSACSQFQQQQQTLLSPINTNFSPKNVHNPLLQASFGVPSSGRMSPRALEPISPMSSHASILAQRDKHQQLRSLSSRELGSNVSAIVGSPANWGIATGKPDWAVNTSDFGRPRRSSSFELSNNEEEPDLSWVQSLVKESPPDVNDKRVSYVSGSKGANADIDEGSTSSSQTDNLIKYVDGANEA